MQSANNVIELEVLSAQDIADYFLCKKALSPKKVQKLVYYAYAWYIALYNEQVEDLSQSLLKEEPEAWMHGPVFPSLYREYRDYGWHDISRNKSLDKNKSVSDSVKEFLEDVWVKYGGFSADQLEYMTHQEDPWKKARLGLDVLAPSNKKISKRDIFIYYNEKI